MAIDPAPRAGPGAVEVLAVVPTLDPGSARLQRLLSSLHDGGCDASVRVVIVANRGAALPAVDHSRPVKCPVGAEVVETGLNLGFAGSVNFAATLAEFTHLWLLQDDLVIRSGCLRSLLAVLDADPRLGAVSPTRVDGAGIVRRGHAGGMLDADGDVATFLPPRNVPLAGYIPDPYPDFVMSRGLLVRAEAWNAVGGMDGRFYPVGWSDVDLCTRLRERGWRVATVPEATLLHEKGASTSMVLSAVTYERNRRLHRAKSAGAAHRPSVHPALSREALEIVAQSAGSLALDLSARATPGAVLSLLMRRLRAVIDRTVASVGRRPDSPK